MRRFAWLRRGLLLVVLGFAVWAVIGRRTELAAALRELSPASVGLAFVPALLAAGVSLLMWRTMLAEFGFRLDDREQRRRWLLKSVLRADGVDAAAYSARFGSSHAEDFPQLDELIRRGWLAHDRCHLTAEGLAHSDTIGPWLVSGPVRAAMAGHALR